MIDTEVPEKEPIPPLADAVTEENDGLVRETVVVPALLK